MSTQALFRPVKRTIQSGNWTKSTCRATARMRPNRKWNRIKNKIVELNILIVNIKSALARLFTLNLLVGASPHDRHHRSSSQCYRKSMIFTLARKRNHKVENSKWRCSSPSTFRLGKELMVIFKRDFNGKQCKTIDGELSLSYRSWCFRRRKKIEKL